jgi:hypothetical protein
MYAIEYRKPKTLAEAAQALSQTGGKALAGGQSLVAAMKLRLAQPGTLVDLGGLAELKGIKKDGDKLVIGASTRHAEIASSAVVKGAVPALCALAEGIGDRQVRNMGTIGGSIANAGESGNSRDVDEPGRLAQPQLHQRHEAVAAGDQFSAARRLKLHQRIVDRRGTLIVECGRDHACPPWPELCRGP